MTERIDSKSMQTLAEWIGKRVAKIREENGDSQDDLARQLREVGLPWRRVTVAEFETGARGLSIEEAILIAVALGVPLDELIGKGPRVALGEAVAQVDDVGAVVVGDLSPERAFESVFDLPWRRAKREDYARLRRYKDLWPRGSYQQIRAALTAAESEVEGVAARSFGIEPAVLSVLAFKRWGRSLTDERDARIEEAGTGAKRGFRGWVTRGLKEELRPDVEATRRRR